MISTVSAAYPNFQVIAPTLRTVSGWPAICWAVGQVYRGMELKGLEILGRVTPGRP